MIKDNQMLDKDFLNKYYDFDKELEMYLIHQGDSRFPSFYYYPEDYAMYIKKGDVKFLLTYVITNFGALKKFYELMGIEIEY